MLFIEMKKIIINNKLILLRTYRIYFFNMKIYIFCFIRKKFVWYVGTVELIFYAILDPDEE